MLLALVLSCFDAAIQGMTVSRSILGRMKFSVGNALEIPVQCIGCIHMHMYSYVESISNLLAIVTFALCCSHTNIA